MVQIIPKPIERVIDWKKISSYLLVLLLIGVIICCLVLVSIERKSTSSLESLQEEIAKGKTPERMALEKELFDWQRKINDFSPLLDQHILNTKFFEFLEKSTHPKIFFSKFDLNSNTFEVTISGQADSFLALGQQISVLSQEPLVTDVNLSNISINKEGKIEFGLNIKLNPQILKY